MHLLLPRLLTPGAVQSLKWVRCGVSVQGGCRVLRQSVTSVTDHSDTYTVASYVQLQNNCCLRMCTVHWTLLFARVDVQL